MKKGIAIVLAIPALVLILPALLGSLRWPFGGSGGLFGTLTALGFPQFIALASWVFLAVMAGMLVGAALNAKGTYHLHQHLADMAPWMLAAVVLAFIVGR